MMKIWCERCKGRGESTKQTVVASFYFVKCPRCEGKGYIENKELERLARIGEATEKAFGENSCVLFIDSIPNTEESFEYELTSVEDLLKWAENKKEVY